MARQTTVQSAVNVAAGIRSSLLAKETCTLLGYGAKNKGQFAVMGPQKGRKCCCDSNGPSFLDSRTCQQFCPMTWVDCRSGKTFARARSLFVLNALKEGSAVAAFHTWTAAYFRSSLP